MKISSTSAAPSIASTTNSQRNVFWSAFDFVVIPVGMLLATPFLVGALGRTQFGVLVLANTLVGVSSVFNFGFGDTAVKFVAYYFNNGDKPSAAKIVQVLGFLSIVSGIAVSSIFALGSPFTSKLLSIDSLPYSQAVIYIIALIMPLRMTESIFISTLRGCYRYDLAGLVTVSIKLLNISLQVTLAVLRYPVDSVLLATVGIVTVSNFVLFVICWRQLGSVYPKFNTTTFLEIYKFASWSWLQGLAGFASANLDKLIVTSMLGPAALGIYGICIQLAQNIHNAASAVAHTVFPRISMFRMASSWKGFGAPDELRALYVTASRHITIISVTISIFVAIFSYEVLDVWVGSDIAEDGQSILTLLAISFCWFTANHTIPYYTLNGLGFAQLQAIMSVICAVIMALACTVLVPNLGLLGAASVRLADLPIRFGVRVYVDRVVVGGIGGWVSMGFLRVSAITAGTSFLLREFLLEEISSGPMFAQTTVLFIIAVYLVCLYWIMNKFESRLGCQ